MAVGHAEEMRPRVAELVKLDVSVQQQYLDLQLRFGASSVQKH